jgi:DNA primase
LRHLAAKAGVELPDKPRTAEDRGKASIWAQIVGVNRLAERRFTANLISPRGEVARDYLKRRGIGDETIRRFRLGYALDEWDDFAE